MRITLCFAAVVLTAVACREPAQPAQPAAAPPPSGPALNEIQQGVIKAHIKMLSSDLFEGRAPSTRGGTLAAEYLANQLMAIGIEPAGENGTYFQEVPIIESTVAAALP